MVNHRELSNLNVSGNPVLHPDVFTTVGSILEDLGFAKIAQSEESHVPFDTAMNGTTLSFLVPDWVIWAFIAFSLVYSAGKMGLI